jgi:hypothetical protein
MFSNMKRVLMFLLLGASPAFAAYDPLTGVIGPVGAGTAAVNSLLIGCVFNTSLPSLTTTQQAAEQCDSSGRRFVSAVGAISNSASAIATSSTNVGAVTYNYGFNGTTWDQLQVDGSKFLKTVVSAALPAGTNVIGHIIADTGSTTAVTGNVTVVQGTGTNLHIVCDSGCSSSSAPADESAFTAGTTSQTPVGGFFQTTATSNPLTTGQMGAFQVTANRALFTNLRNASGTEVGVAATPLQVSLANTASNGTAVTISGTVTANAGTNLNTSLLALEGGGNLAILAGAVSASVLQENVKQINGTAPLMGNGISGTGSQRVTIASDNTAFSVNAAQSGTWTVQPGNTANTTPWLSTINQGGNSATVSAGGALKVDGSAATQPVSGTVTANAGTGTFAVSAASLPLPSGAATSALQSGVQGTVAAGSAPTNMVVEGGVFNTSLPTLTTGQSAAVQLDSSGRQFVNVGVMPSNSTVNVTQFGSSAVVTGTGAGGSGIPRVTVSSDSTVGLVAGSALVGKVGIDQTTPGTTNGVIISPSSASGIGITHIVSSAVESSHVLKSSAGNLYSVVVTTGATGGYLLIFNATSAPADGAVTPAACVPAVANFATSVSYAPGPPSVYSTGITAVFSTTGCFTKTASATAYFDGAIQ